MDIIEAHLEKFGLIPLEGHLDAIRDILDEEISKEKKSQGLGDTELMKLCCTQLFSKKHFEDIFLIWKAKTASFDSNNSIDIQLLCANGLQETKNYLLKSNNKESSLILAKIVEKVKSGDMAGFSFENEMNSYKYYYSDEDDRFSSIEMLFIIGGVPQELPNYFEHIIY